MPLRACMGKHRVQELLVCDAINLIYELQALIWRTDWQHCEGLPTFLRQCERQLTCLDCDFPSFSPAFFFFLFPESIYDGGGRNVKLESGVKFHCVPTSKEITFFTHFERISPPPHSSVTWELIWTAVAMKGQGLLLCKPWKWSSHTVCLCAPLALLPHLNVYSLTAHSFGNISLWSFSTFDNYADGKWLYQRIKGMGQVLECKWSAVCNAVVWLWTKWGQTFIGKEKLPFDKSCIHATVRKDTWHFFLIPSRQISSHIKGM